MSLLSKLGGRVENWRRNRDEKIYENAVIIQTQISGNAARGCLSCGDTEGYNQHTQRWVDAITNRTYSGLVVELARDEYEKGRFLFERLRDGVYNTAEYCLK